MLTRFSVTTLAVIPFSIATGPKRGERPTALGSRAIHDDRRVRAPQMVRFEGTCESMGSFTKCRITARQACYIEPIPENPQPPGRFQLISLLKLNSIAGSPLSPFQCGAFRWHLADRPPLVVNLLPVVQGLGRGAALPDIMCRFGAIQAEVALGLGFDHLSAQRDRPSPMLRLLRPGRSGLVLRDGIQRPHSSVVDSDHCQDSSNVCQHAARNPRSKHKRMAGAFPQHGHRLMLAVCSPGQTAPPIGISGTGFACRSLRRRPQSQDRGHLGWSSTASRLHENVMDGGARQLRVRASSAAECRRGWQVAITRRSDHTRSRRTSQIDPVEPGSVTEPDLACVGNCAGKGVRV